MNSPVKIAQNKDGGTGGSSTRKPSISNHHGSTYSAASGTAARPGTRRRETSESFVVNGPLSPSESKTLLRNDPISNTPPPALLRRRTDYLEDEGKIDNKEQDSHVEGEAEGSTAFSSLRRLATGPLSAGLNGPSSSPWSAAPGGPRSAFESMGGFGNFAVGNSPAGPEAEKRPGFGSARGNSRFKDLLSKTSVEDMSPSVKEKTSFGTLGKLPEEHADLSQLRLRDAFRTRPNRSETNPYDENVPRTGSAALSQDEQGIEQMGFSAFSPAAGHGDVQGTPHGRRNHDPMSPTNTNPYQSPAGGRVNEEEGHDIGDPSAGLTSFGGARRDMFLGGHDRSQSSGFGAPRPGLGGLGGPSGWGSAGFTGGTPGRDRPTVSSAFGDPIFSPITDLQSPSGAGITGGFFGSTGFGSAGRSSRLGALFPPAMQEQMRSDSRNDAFEPQAENRDPFDGARRQESIRNLFEDGRGGDGSFSPQPGVTPQSSVAVPGAGQRGSANPEQSSSGHGLSQSSGSSSSNALPAAQQRQMVMPDRMRWIYRDPQGNVQGPWSGLEMHDWFKAGFFTAELQVKKLEDSEYEPLAQLVRRIGNSREPFLVPQIGVPHGPPTANQGNHWAAAMGTTSGAQPPFANSFPSFGTTLTADQQNALERRKQEEQYLMARQKEHLAQQQMYMKQMQIQNAPAGMHGLQHHSSAHSLQSQPSFGSIASPGGYQPSPMQGPIQPPQSMHGFTQSQGAVPQSSGQEDVSGMTDRMNFNQRTGAPFGASPIGTQSHGIGQGQGTFQERTRIANEGRQADVRAHEEAFLGQDGRNDRLEEFQGLRDQYDQEHDEAGDNSYSQPVGSQRQGEEASVVSKQTSAIGQPSLGMKQSQLQGEESLSLTQQVQRTAAAYEKAAAEDKYIVPPPVSISPLPAPAAQRNRQHVADALAAESRSATQTPVETPTSSSVAPWADKSAEVAKGPSLKEIQEAEAKRAAEQEKVQAAQRRAQAEQERMAAVAAAPPPPGLPSTSTWASSTSPASPGPASVWSKPGVKPVAISSAAAKKNFAQIQKEEEARKLRAAAQAAAQASVVAHANQIPVTGKRYAELANKAAPAGAPTTGEAWTTVGTGGGKAKTPATVVAAPATATRSVSTSSVVAVAKPRPVLQTTRTASVSNQSKAMEEFTKWSKTQLSNGLNAGINGT